MKAAASTRRNAVASVGSAEGHASAAHSTGDRPSTPEPLTPFRETRHGWLVLAAIWAVSTVFILLRLREGWIPSDAGMLAEMANRVLHGQVPHRDFIEVYTGGLTYLNALALRLFGVNFFSMRIPLFLFFLGWVPAVYFIARRFAGPLLAGAVTLLAVAWSVPNYPEAMPSWYNLFFATWGVLALLCYAERRKKRWLWIAGACGGLSFLFKISGLYFIAAGLLFFVFREQSVARAHAEGKEQGGLSYRLFVTVGLAIFFALLTDVVAARPTLAEFFQFVLPTGCLVTFLLWEEWRQPAIASTGRFGRLFGMGLPFLVGAALPVTLFLSWYAHEHALRAWFVGTFVRASRHILWAGYDAVSLAGTIVLVPLLVIVLTALDSHSSARRVARYGSPVLLLILLLASHKWFSFYLLLGCSPPFFVVLTALVAPFCLRRRPALLPLKRQSVFLVVVTAVIFALIQYPYSMLLYFYYVAPLLALALLALWSINQAGEKVAIGSILAFYLAFSVILGAPAFYVAVGATPNHPLDLRTVTIARAGGIRAPERMAQEYENLVALIRRHARGRYIYATPDCPQVYFLSGFRNPTGTIYEFLDPDFLNPAGHQDRLLRTLRDHNVNLVVFASSNPQNSGPVRAGLRVALDKRFPESAMAGKFEVRWKR